MGVIDRGDRRESSSWVRQLADDVGFLIPKPEGQSRERLEFAVRFIVEHPIPGSFGPVVKERGVEDLAVSNLEHKWNGIVLRFAAAENARRDAIAGGGIEPQAGILMRGRIQFQEHDRLVSRFAIRALRSRNFMQRKVFAIQDPMDIHIIDPFRPGDCAGGDPIPNHRIKQGIPVGDKGRAGRSPPCAWR